jgi:hypothetical protein
MEAIMIKKLFVVVLLLLTPVVLFSWGGTKIRGFEGGESVSEVKSLEKTTLIDEKTEDNFTILLYEDELFSMPCSVLYRFYGGKLDNIELYFGPDYLRKLDNEQLTERIKDPLDESNVLLKYMRFKYGNENATDYIRHDRSSEYRYFWSLDDIRIEMVSEKRYGDYENVRVLYYFNDKLEPPISDMGKF